MPQYRLPEMSIAQGSYAPTAFQGTAWTPQQQDVRILQQSLAQIEARQEKAVEKQTAVDVALGQIENQLHQDEETNQWFANYKNDIKKQIQDDVDAGNYGAAIRTATSMAGKIASDSAITGRIKANEKYKKATEEVNARTDIDRDTKDWWLATHQYQYEDVKDAQGNVIGGKSPEYLDKPQAPVDYKNLSAIAIQLAAPEKTSVSREGTRHRGTGEGVKEGETVDYSWTTGGGTAESIQELTEEKLNEVMAGVFASTHGAKAAVIQDRNVSLWKLNQLKEKQANAQTPEEAESYNAQIKLYENDLYDNGILMGEDEYIAKKVSPILHNAAYRWKDTKSSSIDSRDPLSNTKGSGDATITGLPKGLLDGQNPLKVETGGLVMMPWSNYGQQAKTSVASAADAAKNIVSRK